MKPLLRGAPTTAARTTAALLLVLASVGCRRAPTLGIVQSEGPSVTSPGASASGAAGVPAGMARVAGGVVTLGPYDADPADWGKHEVWLDPFFIERRGTLGLGAETCERRPGHLATVAELEAAMQLGAAQPTGLAEETSSVAAPAAADAGTGNFDVLFEYQRRIVLRPLRNDTFAGTPARCVIPEGEPPARVARAASRATELRRGRGESWPRAGAFIALDGSRHDGGAIAAGQTLYFVHADGAWAFVARYPSSDGAGWVPLADLAAAPPRSK